MKNILTFLSILFASLLYGQVSFVTIPLDKQLIGRDIITNTGDVIIEGEVNNTGVTYDAVVVKRYRDGVFQNTFTETLTFTGNLASFNFAIPIIAELHNYSFKIYGKLGSLLTLEDEVEDVVAGDVYIIQGQSNAVAYNFGDTAPDVLNHSEFIRVFANGTSDETDLQNNNYWYEGSGGLWIDEDGNTGVWGQKIAKLLVDSKSIPVAIFNGAHPGEQISFFEPDNGNLTYIGRNYGRMYYRLNETGLKNNVRAVFWSQGEADGSGQANTSLMTYKNSFINLKNNWLLHYPNIEKFYIFQTKNGSCEGVLHKIKEAQRQLAFENSDITIMPTASFIQRSDDCHFDYVDGYETFADRLFPLVDRDIYGVTTTNEIDAPMILGAILTSTTTLEVETDATSLSIATIAEDFALGNASGATITNIAVTGNKIIFTLSANPGVNATISYLAQDAGVVGNFITNSNGIEIQCFYKYSIDASTLNVNNFEFDNNFVIVNEDSNLLIKSNSVIRKVKVYDITGRLLIENKSNDSELRINTLAISKGTMLIVNAIFENGAEVSKKAIKY